MNMQNRKIIAIIIICACTILSLTSCLGLKLPAADTSRATQVTTDSATTEPAPTEPAATVGSVLLQITEDKVGYSIAGEPLPHQNQTREFTLAKDDKVYEGLPDKANEFTRAILTLTDITDKSVTVILLDNGQEATKDINYNTPYTYTAFTNPDEYSYEYTITFVK